MSTVETVVPEAAAPESSLSSDFGQLMGEISPEPEPSTPSEGTTPAAAEPATDTALPDGETTVETPPSEEITSAAAAPVVEDDPFKDTTPASYMLNGKPVAVEDIRVFAEGGAVIRPESLPNILSKLAERDTLEARERTASQQVQTFTKAVEWTSPEGKQFTGPEAAVEMRIGSASLFAENALMSGVIQSEDLQPYLTTKQVMGPDGQPRYVVIFKPEAINDLVRERDLQSRELRAKISDHYKTALQAAPHARPVDFNAAAPTLIQQVAQASNLDASILTPADKSILAKHLPFHTRNGLASLEWQELVKDRIQERLSQKSSTAKVVDSTTKAVKEGQARMAAAARGVKPNVARPTSPKPVVPTPQSERADNQGAMFDALLASGASAMRTAR